MSIMVEINEIESYGKGAYDITHFVKKYIDKNKIENGLIIISALDQLCALTMIEYEPNLINDLGKLLENMPINNDYVKLSLFHRTLIIPLYNNDLFLGSFQQVVLIDLNKEKGIRKIAIEKVDL